MHRRELLGLAAGSALVAHTLQGELAQAQEYFSDIKVPGAAAGKAGTVTGSKGPLQRGADGRLLRMGSLDLESQQDFTLAFRQMHARQIRVAANNAFQRLLEAEGIDPTTPMSVEQLRELVAKDPAINFGVKCWISNQQITWKTLRDYYHQNADYYLAEMEAADKSGPGALVLSPAMTIPDYARHEIHIQPGGYVGDPFAGHIYHYGTNSFYISQYGHNEQDEIHRSMAGQMPIPADGKVKRILDMGCGVGQLTVALKERFPDAEVWGIDVGGPMVRYSHLRAARMGIGANFAQKLAEDTGYPDNHFDIVTSYIMHHEMPADVTRQVVAEAQRVTRPGGVYYPIDFKSGGTKTNPRQMYSRWWDHRWNNEVWSLEYHSMNFTDEVAQRGFTQVQNATAALPGFGVRHFVRTA